MFERIDIEQGLPRFMDMMSGLEASVYAIQAQAVRNALQHGDKDREIANAMKKLQRVAKFYRVTAGRHLQRELVALIEKDMRKQLDFYNEAYRRGIVKIKPVVPKSVTFSRAVTMAATTIFVNKTIDRAAQYAGYGVSDIIAMAIGDKLDGVPLGKIAKAASNLILSQGLKIKTPSGRNIHDVFAYVRQNVVSAVIFNSAEQQRKLYDSIDMPDEKKWYEVSSHWAARPDHALWQGRLYQSWDALAKATGYGEITGLAGINCRHTFYPFIQGVSTQRFFPKPLRENNRRYEAQQLRRHMESNLRKMKEVDAVNEALGLPRVNSGKIKRSNARLRDHKKVQQQVATDYADAA